MIATIDSELRLNDLYEYVPVEITFFWCWQREIDVMNDPYFVPKIDYSDIMVFDNTTGVHTDYDNFPSHVRAQIRAELNDWILRQRDFVSEYEFCEYGRDEM